MIDYDNSVRCGRDNMAHAPNTDILKVKAGDEIDFAITSMVPEDPYWHPPWTVWDNCPENKGLCSDGVKKNPVSYCHKPLSQGNYARRHVADLDRRTLFTTLDPSLPAFPKSRTGRMYANMTAAGNGSRSTTWDWRSTPSSKNQWSGSDRDLVLSWR
jgi:hypothetical protein